MLRRFFYVVVKRYILIKVLKANAMSPKIGNLIGRLLRCPNQWPDLLRFHIINIKLCVQS